jgi:hypothetical protein
MSKGLIVVGGALANKAGQGGEAWVRLNWVLGLKKLGYRVLFLEQMPNAGRGEIEYFNGVIDRFDLGGSAALIDKKGAVLAGHDVIDLAREAQALINISGHLRIEGKFRSIPRKVYVDLDPGFTQIWHAQGNRGARLEGHDFYFTVGENIGARECSIPTVGIQWHKTKPPIVLEQWPLVTSQSFQRFSTVANWRGPYGVLEFGGQTFGLKVHEFRKFIGLPKLTGLPFEIALSIHPGDFKDREALQEHGWRLVDPNVAASPDGFRSYIQKSSAEFSVAQGIYVQTQSGWFSDRTAAYLASGKPALLQDTGFSQHLPTGDGLLAFASLEQAIDGAEKIRSNYAHHCRAARAVATEYFGSDKVLRRLLVDIGLR